MPAGERLTPTQTKKKYKQSSKETDKGTKEAKFKDIYGLENELDHNS